MNPLNKIVSDYVARFRHQAEQELRWFQIQPTLERAVSIAALAKGPSGKRLSHQRRIPQSALDDSRARLLRSLPALQRAKSFEELHELVKDLLEPVAGIGRLTIYDTTLRIAAKLGLEPNVVFLHAGTKVGARRLNLNTSRAFILIKDIPQPLRRLRPREVEDVLCIYKDRLRRARGSMRTKSSGFTKSKC